MASITISQTLLLIIAFLLEANTAIASNNSMSSPEMPRIDISPAFLSFGLTFLLAAMTFFLFSRKGSPHSLPPGPKAWPIVGNLPELLLKKPTFRWIHKMMEDMGAEILCIRLGNVHVIPVTSPEIAVEFLKKHDTVCSSRPVCLSAELTSRGYLTTALTPLGDHWKKMRRVLASDILSPERHRWLARKRAEEADHLMRYIFNQNGGVVNVRVATQHYCGNVIRKMIFGKRFFGVGREDGGPGVEEEEHVNGLFTILRFLYSFCVSDYVPLLRGRVDLDGHEGIMRWAIESVTKYQDPEVDERIRQWNEGTKMEQEDLLDVLIMLKDKDGNSPLLAPDEIKAQILELMLAAVDNPSNAVEWALAEMINQPETLQRATEELDRVVGKHRMVQESDLPNLNYVKACVRESFRLHPIAPFNLPHVSVSDATVAGYFIPKGSHVLLSRPGLGRNPRAWAEPLRFRPERHLREDGSAVVLTDPDLRMLSFSIGRRGCAGVTLGSTMTVMLMARLLHGFTWELPYDVLKIELKESDGDLFLAKPLLALARPRLDENLHLSL
ncbi:Isoleucine N-monooxygenase [Actinidia chinensis var. chinensis]|uniref:Isoleucine N-monooxygenase n=1 Tax=Actinidia chinensis var. chinensis TaxID=1590841 RepID=A0A2R6P6K8_ACTCC|nr:Isoleucine N-monooxygenase [Actinidia chinensis var. chinensis]